MLALDVQQLSKKFATQDHGADSVKAVVQSWFAPGRHQSNKEFVALSQVSFQVHKGEVLGVIGKNGAGKSTLLKILSGVTFPDEGSVDFYGRSASVLDIGSGFHPDLTGRENILLNGQLYGFSSTELQKIFKQVVAFSGIGEFIDEPVKNYSSGMYLRLAFALVAHIDADILIFDEVLSVGDAEFQKKCNAKLVDLKNTGKSIVLVSHNLNDVMKLCDKVIILEQGQLKHSGTAYEMISLYLEQSLLNRQPGANAVNGNVDVDYAGVTLENQYLEVTHVSVNNTAAGSIGSIYVEDELNLKIELKVKSDFLPFRLGLVLRDITGNPVCSINSETSLQSVVVGEYVWVGKIAAHIFNTSVFYVDLALVHDENHLKSLIIQSLVYIKFSDRLAADNIYKGRFLGLFRPAASWQLTKKIDNEKSI